jgi:lipopolysaccharide export system permease protein
VIGPVQLIKYIDSSWKTKKKISPVKSFDKLIPDSIKGILRERVATRLSSLQVSNELALSDFKEQDRNLRTHQIEWHRKISLSFACLVLYLIGAPLGSIIRKGGLGSPLVFAIVFFMLFYFSSTTGENFAKEGSVAPWVGMWMSTFVLLPIGIFLIYKALQDSQFFNKEYYYRAWRKIKAMLKRKG